MADPDHRIIEVALSPNEVFTLIAGLNLLMEDLPKTAWILRYDKRLRDRLVSVLGAYRLSDKG